MLPYFCCNHIFRNQFSSIASCAKFLLLASGRQTGYEVRNVYILIVALISLAGLIAFSVSPLQSN